MKKRLLALLLTLMMMVSALPVQAFAAEDPIALPEAELTEGVAESGHFYLASNAAELREEGGGRYLLRVVRGGETLEASDVRLELVDVTANYGKDYKVSLSGSGLFAPGVQNKDESRSLMDQIQEEGVQEDVQEELTYAGMTDEEIEAAAQEQADEFGEVLSEELSNYAEEHPDRYLKAADGSEPAPDARDDTQDGETEPPQEDEQPADAEGEEAETPQEPEPEQEATAVDDPETVLLNDTEQQSSLSAAYEAQTGRVDDWQAMSSDGSSILDTASLMQDYTMDSMDAISEGLQSAYLDISFDEGETERSVIIQTIDNNKGQGDRIFMARLVAQSDNARVNSEFSRCMCRIVDDEDWEAPTVSFAASSFEANNGFVDVVIRREGLLTPVSTVHLTTSDGTALGDRDYSQVDANVAFPFGVEERTIHIPVRSTWLTEESQFNLTLTEGSNASLGDLTTAVGVIQQDSESFVMTTEEAGDGEARLMVDAGGVKVGDPIDLANLASYSADGTGGVTLYGGKLQIRADSGDISAQTIAWSSAKYYLDHRYKTYRMSGNNYYLSWYHSTGIEYSGVQIKSSRNDGGSPHSELAMWASSGGEVSADSVLGSDGTSWASQTHNFYESTASGKQGVMGIILHNRHKGGTWRDQNTLEVEEIRPILRPFVFTVEIANPSVLYYVNNEGKLQSYDQLLGDVKSAGELTLGGANTGENAVVKYLGDRVEVSTPGRYSYIKKLQVEAGNGKIYDVTNEYPVGTKTASFGLDSSAAAFFWWMNCIDFTENKDSGAGGCVGNIRLKVVMGKIPTTVTLNNNDARGTVALGFDVHKKSDSGYLPSDGKYSINQDDRDFRKVYRGDFVRFTESLNSRYSNSFTANTIRVKRELLTNTNQVGYSNDAYETFDKNQSAWQVTMFNDYSSLTAWPSFADIDNHIVIRVKDSDKALFDTTKGIFTAKTIPGISGYTDYEVVTTSGFAAHQFYTLTATPKDANNVAVWKPGNATIGYSQNTYYHEGQTAKSSNLITLTCEEAEATPFSITGEAYYAALDLLTGVEGETWQPAAGMTVELTPSAYAMSDNTGKLATIPFKGVAGDKVVVRTEAMGTVNYKYLTLSKGAVKGIGTDESKVNAYTVSMGTFVVPPINPDVPSVTAASLSDNTGVAIRTAAVWPSALTAADHQYTFGATVSNDGVEYTDTDGKTRTEHVKKVEFIALDGATNQERGVLGTATSGTDNGSGSKLYSITALLSYEKANVYRPGDKVYVRITTDRVKGNGKSIDENGNVLVDEEGKVWQVNETGQRVPVTDGDGNQLTNTSLLETVYAPVYTGYDLVSAANETPKTLDVNILDGNLDDIFMKLPVFGSLNSTLRLSKLAVSQQELPNGGISLCIGYRLFTDKDKNVDNVKDFVGEFDGFKDAASKMMKFGEIMNTPPKMTLGVGSAGVNPFVGIYLDFGLDKDKTSSGTSFTFIGGGLYVGVVGFFKAVVYFPIGPIPAYFGVEGNLTAYLNWGIQVPENGMTINEINSKLNDNDTVEMDFKLKVQTTVSIYVGVGLCGTLGVRGGLSFNMAYLFYPSVKNINPAYHTQGFSINLNLKIWVDAFVFSVPIPALSLVHETYGYARDIEQGIGNTKLASAADDAPITRQVAQPSGWMPEGAKLQSTLAVDNVTELVENNYPYADPQLLDTGNELIMVFLTTESFFDRIDSIPNYHKGRGDETSLAYSIYRYNTTNPYWSFPKRLGNEETMKTGDFEPNVILTDIGEIQVSWISRKNESWADDPENPTTQERLNYLKQMEVYSASYSVDCGDLPGLTLKRCDRVTDDDYYNSQPQATCSIIDGVFVTNLYYLASEPDVKTIAADDPVYTDFQNEESRQLLANVSPTQNGCFQMAKRYNHTNNQWEGKTPAGTFVETPVNGQNRPVIKDFTVQPYRSETSSSDRKYWDLFAYTVDDDRNLSTPYDTELYLQLYDVVNDKVYDPIQLTSDTAVAVSRPQFTENRYKGKLLWYEAPDTTGDSHAYGKTNGDVKMLNLNDLFEYGLYIDTADGKAKLKQTVSISELKAMGYAVPADENDLKDYPYSLPIETVNIAEDEQFEDGPTLSTFIPYQDGENNIYIVWLQTMTHEQTDADGNVQKVQTNELYAAAQASDSAADGKNRWSMPVRLTNDEQFYDEATLAYVLGPSTNRLDKLFVLANRYTFALQDANENTKPVDAADYVAMQFGRAGSVEPVDIHYTHEMPQAGDEVNVTVTLRNTGLLTANNGGSYSIYPLVKGSRAAAVKEGSFTTNLLPGDTEEISFTYTMPDDLSGMREIGFEVISQETGYENKADVCFEGEDAIPVGWRAALGTVETEERNDGFYVTYDIMNFGNVNLPAGAVLAKAGKSTDMDEPWATQALDKTLSPGETAEYTVKLENVEDDFSVGLQTGFLVLTDADGKELADTEATRELYLALTAPYNLTVNGDASLATKGITLKAGQELALSGTYEGKSFYPDGKLLFATEDSDVAIAEDGKLYALEAGETTLLAKVDARGTAVRIPVTVKAAGSTPSPSPSTPSTTEITVEVSSDEGAVSVTAEVSGSTAAVTAPTEAQMEEVVGKTQETGAVTIDLSSLPETVTAVSIPAETVKAIDEAMETSGEGLTIKLPNSTVTFDPEALASIAEQTTGKDLKLNVDPITESKLNAKQKEALADLDVQAVYDIYLTSDGKRITDFGGGKAAIQVTYQGKDGQQPGGIEVWYVADEGGKTWIPTTATADSVTFTVTHFSNYVLTYDETLPGACAKDDDCPMTPFTDLDKSSWYHDGVHWALENSVMNGVGNNKFNPSGTTSRAMIVTMLYRMEGEPEITGENPFNDVKADTWYTDAVIWAAENEIVNGYGGGKFGPEDDLSREQLVTILQRYANYKGIDTSEGEMKPLKNFDDTQYISDWAVKAFRWAVDAGIINGTGNGKISPKTDASRAQVATMLMRYDSITQ